MFHEQLKLFLTSKFINVTFNPNVQFYYSRSRSCSNCVSHLKYFNPTGSITVGTCLQPVENSMSSACTLLYEECSSFHMLPTFPCYSTRCTCNCKLLNKPPTNKHTTYVPKVYRPHRHFVLRWTEKVVESSSRDCPHPTG